MLTLTLLSLLSTSTEISAAEAFKKENEWIVDYEAGALFVFRNDQRYGENGTWFNARDTGQNRSFLFNQRASLELHWRDRHFFSFLYAPIDVTTFARFSDEEIFRDETFPANTAIKFRYQFDGWRGTYQYKIVKSSRWQWNAGVALQIRSASVELASANGEKFVYDSDIGPVPALSTRLVYTTESGLYAMLDATGAYVTGLGGGVDGGVLDAALTLGIPVNDSLDLVLRLREYGGGAIVPRRDIGNWGWYGSAVAGIRLNLSALGRKN